MRKRREKFEGSYEVINLVSLLREMEKSHLRDLKFSQICSPIVVLPLVQKDTRMREREKVNQRTINDSPERRDNLLINERKISTKQLSNSRPNENLFSNNIKSCVNILANPV